MPSKRVPISPKRTLHAPIPARHGATGAGPPHLLQVIASMGTSGRGEAPGVVSGEIREKGIGDLGTLARVARVCG